MKYILFTTIFTFTALLTFAQQERQNTQFMQYKLGYNPAYAGSQATPCLTAIYRQQWIGLDGAPETQILSFNMPILNQRIGIGANLERNAIGHFEEYG